MSFQEKIKELESAWISMGSFTKKRFVQEGAYGMVYLVEDAGGIPFAYKQRKMEENYEELTDEMYEREIDALELFRGHPNILTLVRYDCLGMVCEWCAGKPWCSWMGKLSRKKVKIAAMELLNAISHIHSKGWLHRDVSSANIYFDENGRTKLGDFGMARAKETTMTRFVVTRWYRHPKLFDSSQEHMSYGGEVDMWAAACCIAELSEGIVQFKGETDDEQCVLVHRMNWEIDDEDAKEVVLAISRSESVDDELLSMKWFSKLN